MRVAVLGGDCSGLKYHIGMDKFRADDDILIQSKGIQIHVDELSAQYLWGSEVDWFEVDDEAGFVILNPNKGRSLDGCGKDGKGGMTKGDGKTCLKSTNSCSTNKCNSCTSKKDQVFQVSLA